MAKARALAEEVRDRDGLAAFVKEEAQELLKNLDAIGKPITLKFTAVDGRAIDLQALKGKVVIIDFWATWCASCLRELATLNAVYEKYHSQGFEIVGISFDERREDLTRFLAKRKIPWPQFCDGKGWKNHLGMKLGVKSLPTQFLVDREGRLRDVNARTSLEEKVRKLLAEAFEATLTSQARELSTDSNSPISD